MQEAGPDNLGAYELVPSGKSSNSSSSRVSRRVSRRFHTHERRNQETEWQKWGREVLQSNTCQTLTLILIMSNAVFIGLETDLDMHSGGKIAEAVFLVVFTCELVLRLIAYRAFFFDCMENEDFHWNLLDFLIVTSGVFGTFFVMFSPNAAGPTHDVLLFRTVRLLRILRILRVVRVFRFLKQLYLLAYGFIEGASAVLWVALLAFCCIYMCAVILVRLYRGEDNSFIQNRFSTIPATMFTLFEIMSAPDLEKYRAEIFDYPLLIGFIVIYIIFGSFGINGLLTGLISESILEKNQARVESERLERETKRQNVRRDASMLFDQISDAVDTSLTPDNVMEYEEEIQTIFDKAGASVTDYDFHHMLEVMDYDGNGTISKPEFINGILEMCDDIRPMSIMEIHSAVAQCNNKVNQCLANMESMMSTLEELRGDVRTHHADVAQASEQARGHSPENLQTSKREANHVSSIADDCTKAAAPHAAPQLDVSPVFEQRSQQMQPLGHSKLASDWSDVQRWQKDVRDQQLQEACKERADELLRKVSDALAEFINGFSDREASVHETSVSARQQQNVADELQAAKPKRRELRFTLTDENDEGQNPITLRGQHAEPETSALVRDIESQAVSVGLEGPVQPERDLVDVFGSALAESQPPDAHI